MTVFLLKCWIYLKKQQERIIRNITIIALKKNILCYEVNNKCIILNISQMCVQRQILLADKSSIQRNLVTFIETKNLMYHQVILIPQTFS